MLNLSFRAICISIALLMSAVSVNAQSTAISLVSPGHDPSMPLEVVSDSLSVDQETGTAVFSGNVVAIQSKLKLSADKVEVVYADDDKDRIGKLIATGNVIFTNGVDAAEAQRAVYDMESGLLLMEGDALLIQGATAISGQSITINLAEGKAVFSGRVTTVIQSAPSK